MGQVYPQRNRVMIMSKLDKLIEKLCPEGVEFKPMWSLTAWDKKFNGIDRNMQKKVVPYHYFLAAEFDQIEREDGDIFYISTGITGKDRFTTEELAGDNLAEGEVVCIPWGGTPNVKYYKGKFVTGDNRIATSLDPTVLDNKYLYYWMQSQIELIGSFYRGSGIKHPSMKSVLELRVPVPPVEVQREIVRVLDNFTFLSAELSAELSARRKQYEYYRNQMLSFDTDVQRIPMGDLFEFRNGLSKGKEFFGRGTPFIRYTDVYNHRSLRKDDIDALVECTPDELRKLKVSRGDVLFTRTSETAEDVGWSSVMLDDMDNCVFNGFTIKASPKTDLLWPEYCAYCFATDSFRNYVTKQCAFTTRASLTGSTIADYKLAVPSLTVQKRIAEVLDNFETICNDLGIGLPAEIEARQKQYEYYRDKLLTFKEKA